MAVTTQAQEAAKLRAWLTPYLKGPNVNAVLNSLATSSAYLVNSVQAVNNSLYVVTAQGPYLDLKLANYGITRDPLIGISDDVFRTIGIQVKNRKQVRDLINNILDAVFGDAFCKATSDAENVEPYALQDGDTLIINYDGADTVTVTFSASNFTNIAAATAQEVADAIAISLSSQNLSGSAIVNNNGNGNYVRLISQTIGASSSITVLGGSAQNVLQFPAEINSGGNSTTQWTITPANGGLLRFTWSGGGDPKLGYLQDGDYVNIFGGGFASSTNEGSFTIQNFEGGAVDDAYFEIENPTGSTGIVTQGTDDAVLFYSPVRETILSKQYYAAVYSTETNILEIFMPATTQIIQTSRIGSAHLHGVSETPVLQFILPAGTYPPNPPSPYPPPYPPPTTGAGEYFIIDNIGLTNVYYFWFNVDGGNTDPAPTGFIGIEVAISSSDSAAEVANKTYLAVSAVLPTLLYNIPIEYAFTVSPANATVGATYTNNGHIFTVQSTISSTTTSPILVTTGTGAPSTSGTLTLATGTGDAEISFFSFVPSDTNILTITNPVVSTESDAGPSLPTALGPYIFDPVNQGFVVGVASTTLTADVNGETGPILNVVSSEGFFNGQGYLVIGYGTELQELVPYIAAPSSGTLLKSPAYFIQQDHPAGSSVMFVTQRAPVTLPTNGSYYQPFLTDDASARVWSQGVIDAVAAAGVTVIYTILYPNDIGLGKWGTQYSEISYVYGP